MKLQIPSSKPNTPGERAGCGIDVGRLVLLWCLELPHRLTPLLSRQIRHPSPFVGINRNKPDYSGIKNYFFARAALALKGASCGRVAQIPGARLCEPQQRSNSPFC